MNATTTTLILVLAAGTLLFKALGPVIAGGRQPPARVIAVIELLTPALITALIVSGTFGHGQQLVLDARVVGVGVGAVALWLRLPAVVALVLAAGACALVRTLG